MRALFLLNFVLIAIPIGITLGILLGIQSHRAATGKRPLFRPEDPTDPTDPTGPGGGRPPKKGDNGIKIVQHCNETLGISPLSLGDQYTLNPNPWGWDKGDPGSICLNVTAWNNQTYPKPASAPEWSVTWQFPPGPETAPVHAYPNAKVDSGVFPTRVGDIEEILLDFEWTYAVGNTTAKTTTDESELKDSNLNANVALDMFLDKDEDKAKDSQLASTEIMVWFAAYGPATQPIGFKKKLDSVELDGTTFVLYSGKNGVGQNVLTWYSPKPSHKFHGDLGPLVTRLVEMGGAGSPKDTDYIGYLSLGTETYFSDEVVTFHVPQLAIDVNTKDQ